MVLQCPPVEAPIELVDLSRPGAEETCAQSTQGGGTEETVDETAALRATWGTLSRSKSLPNSQMEAQDDGNQWLFRGASESLSGENSFRFGLRSRGGGRAAASRAVSRALMGPTRASELESGGPRGLRQHLRDWTSSVLGALQSRAPKSEMERFMCKFKALKRSKKALPTALSGALRSSKTPHALGQELDEELDRLEAPRQASEWLDLS